MMDICHREWDKLETLHRINSLYSMHIFHIENDLHCLRFYVDNSFDKSLTTHISTFFFMRVHDDGPLADIFL